MDFKFTAQQEAFRREVVAFIEETLTDEFKREQAASDNPSWSPEFSRAAAARGWLGIAWPEEFGGQGRGYLEQMIYMEEMANAAAPQEHHRRAVQQVGPSIILHGTDEQKRRYLSKIASAEISFAMGLSEPNAGSDLAGVELRAVRDGDDFVLNGAKRFTSGAHYSDYIWTVVRTDPDAPKHRGISMLVADLHAPGVSVQPLIDMNGRHHFNEVFFDDVRVPAENLVGELNRGWYVNATTMDFERSGISRIAELRRSRDRALADMRAKPPSAADAPLGSAAKRARLAEHAVAVEVSQLLAYRVAWQQSSGQLPNQEVAITKVLATETAQSIQDLMVNFSGPAGNLSGVDAVGSDTELAEEGTSWGETRISAIPATIAQGSNEIQRNVIATRGLGLPRG